ncbi:hypothetical protein O3G_MSEX010597 [Manduca sexta]|uniref:Uncharacterized protein n=1 Tax=Manduca sexta TaxID=7130 RepID=A0A921ZIB3_MANSE|nr:hypothetical protein O3G_MSEX010597 [Manduca sexta]
MSGARTQLADSSTSPSLSENRRLEYSGLKFAYAEGSDEEGPALSTELPSCVYAAARSRLQLPLAAYVHQHTRQLHNDGLLEPSPEPEYQCNGSPYRVQRAAANVRERRRMLSENRRLEYSGLKFAYAEGSDEEGPALSTELPSCVYAAARSRLQLPLAAYVHQHTRQLHNDGLLEPSPEPEYQCNGSPYRVQRAAANVRERRRMLRSGPNGYHLCLLHVLDADYDPLTYVEKCLRGEIKADRAHWNTSDLTARLSWINWENLGVNPQRRSVLTSLALSSDNLQYTHN